MENTASVDVIVTCKNNEAIISECIDSILSQSFKDIKLYICDDGSTDKTLDIIKEKYPKATVLKLSFGPARNRNEALNVSSSPYIVTMDSDAILTPNWIEEMVKIMESDPKIGSAGGMMLQDEKTVFSKGGLISKRGFARDLGYKNMFIESECSSIVYPAYVCSASMIMRRKLVEDIGGFEPSFCYSYEDVDFGLRANLAGWKVACFNKIRSYHLAQKTVNKTFNNAKREYLTNSNRLYTLLSNFEIKTILRELPLHAADFINLVFFKKEKMAFLRSYLSVFGRFGKIYKSRKKNFAKRRISDRILFEKISKSE
jgi:GT2 family glycosyltransferase